MKNYLSDKSWLEFEKNHVWHPYAPLEGALPPYPVKSAQGVHLTLEDGRNLIDGMSSWWSAIHGYNHPVLNQAARAQLGSMSHVMFGGLTHRPAAELAARLVRLAPGATREGVFLRFRLSECRGCHQAGDPVLDRRRTTGQAENADDPARLSRRHGRRHGGL